MLLTEKGKSQEHLSPFRLLSASGTLVEKKKPGNVKHCTDKQQPRKTHVIL